MAPNLILLVAARYNVTFITDETRAARNGEPAHKYQSRNRSCGQGFVTFYGGMYKKKHHWLFTKIYSQVATETNISI